MFITISILTIALGIIMAVYNWNINKNSIFLALFFIEISLYGMAYYVFLYGKSAFWFAILFNHFAALSLLLGPFLLFYVRGTYTDKVKLTKSDLVHFIPFLITLISTIPYILKPFEYKKHIAALLLNDPKLLNYIDFSIFFTVSQSNLIRIFSLFFYVVYLVWFILIKERTKYKNKNIPLDQFIISYRWLTIFLTLLLVLIVNNIASVITTIITNDLDLFKNMYVAHFITGLTYFLMSFSLLIFPQVLYGMPIYKKTNIPKYPNNSSEKLKLIKQQDQYEEGNPFNELSDRILEYLHAEKPFLNANFSLSDIAIKLQVPEHHISYCLNVILKSRFTKLKTTLRINHAKELLLNGTYSNMTIDGIGQSSGFSTRSNFYNAFKSETGLTPKEFMEQSVKTK